MEIKEGYSYKHKDNGKVVELIQKTESEMYTSLDKSQSALIPCVDVKLDTGKTVTITESLFISTYELSK